MDSCAWVLHDWQEKAHILRINTSEQLAGSLFSASRQDSTESVSVQGVAVLVTVVVAG